MMIQLFIDGKLTRHWPWHEEYPFTAEGQKRKEAELKKLIVEYKVECLELIFAATSYEFYLIDKSKMNSRFFKEDTKWDGFFKRMDTKELMANLERKVSSSLTVSK